MSTSKFLGLCAQCGCNIYSEGVEEFEGTYCNHKLLNSMYDHNVKLNLALHSPRPSKREERDHNL